MQGKTPARRASQIRVKDTVELGIYLKQAEGVFWVEGRVLFLSGGDSKKKYRCFYMLQAIGLCFTERTLCPEVNTTWHCGGLEGKWLYAIL